MMGDDKDVVLGADALESAAYVAVHGPEQARITLALSVTTPGEVLAQLSGDGSEQVRLAVARNKKTPHHVVARLSRDASRVVRTGLAADIETPLEILNELAEDPDEHVRALAKESRRVLAAKMRTKLSASCFGIKEALPVSLNPRWGT